MSTATTRPPLSQHRQSISGSTNPLAATRLPSHSRNNSHSHSHSALSGSLNASHRVNRRKSITNTGANVAAVAAALTEAGDKMTPLPMTINGRRGTISKSATARSAITGSLPSPPASLPTHKFMMAGKPEGQESAIDDDSNEMSAEEGENGFQKARVRRASDGQPLTKEGKKSNRIELHCDQCGKTTIIRGSPPHIAPITRIDPKENTVLTFLLVRWEHTPEWSYTSKLLISKHQQVQLLEAASVLVQMNVIKDESTPPDSARDFGSEPDSAASPAASGYSDQHDGRSSADTTPPPQTEAYHGGFAFRNVKRSSNGSVYARSYQSTTSNGFLAGSIPNGSGFGHNRHGSSDRRPTSSGLGSSGQEDKDLAAAVELLSCSFGSNGGSRDTRLPEDAPPVPPLPAQYLDQAAFTSTSFLNSYSARQMPESFTRGQYRHSEDVRMEDSEMDDDEDDRRSRVRSEDDDDGVFGRMEE
ncbi:putative C2H2-type domain-containing protein [Seiridium cardinale]|uniref:C2H2-type domain-containing protein n=1 Tax=Seiridium cardinale TaxID=138064 RepID=A0ABR2XBJ2_9PEZI